MADQPELESLYREAQSALKSRDYVRASELLRQILQIDENYKDTSRLLAQMVKLRRRRWYNHPLLWGGLALAGVVGLGFWLAPKLGNWAVSPTNIPPASAPTRTRLPTETFVPTIAPSPTATAVPLAWKRVSIGQEFERDTVTVFVIDPKDPDMLYAGMKNAGIYKSIDEGLSWRPAHHGIANTHITSLLIDSGNPKILYAGTLDGIYKTENGGDVWLIIAEGTHVLMDPQTGSHLYGRDDKSIYESVDGGKNWATIFSSTRGCPDTIISWAIHPVDGKTLFVGGGEMCEEGVYQSNDGGRTWTLVEKMVFEAAGADITSTNPEWFSIGLDGRGDVALRPSEIVAYDPSGTAYSYWDASLQKQEFEEAQWTRLGKPDVGIFTSITISPLDPNMIYVTGKGVSVSKDGGLTWSKLNNGLGSTILRLESSLANLGTLYLLSGNCENGMLEFRGDKRWDIVQPLYISMDSGSTWSFSFQVGCYLIEDADGSTLYRIGNPGRGYSNGLIWRSPDAGKSWKLVPTPHQVITLTTDQDQSGLLYLYTKKKDLSSNEYFVSEDYGRKWKVKDSPASIRSCYGSTLQFIDAYRPMAIDPSNGNHVFVIDNGALLESHDSCDTTGTFATAPNTNMNSIAFDPNNSNTICAGTDSGAYISFDGGQSWNQINDGLLGATVVYSIVVDKDSNVYAATPYGIFKLENR